jgi:Zn-dependent protease with chaperone function
LLVPFGALAIVLLWDAWRLSRQARGLSLQLDAVTTRTLDGDVRVVDTPRALAAATAWPCRRIYVSESALAKLDSDEIDALLEHERAHIRRHDSYFLLLARLGSVLLMPSTRRRLLEELHLAVEQACDRQAARRVGPEVVASALIKFARLAQQSVPAVVPTFGVEIGPRVEALLDPIEDVSPPRWRLQVACLLAVLPASWVLHELGEWLLLPLVR